MSDSHGQRRSSLAVRYRLRDCDRVGSGIVLRGKPHIHNLGHITLASDIELSSSPVVSHLVTGPNGRIDVGSGACIGHGAAVAAYERVEIGERAAIGPFVMIMDTDFHQAGKSGAVGETSPIYIGADARLGARVVVLRGAHIGDGAVVAAGSVVSGDIPAGASVAGVPARIQYSAAIRESAAISFESVALVVARTFGLSHPPAESVTREEIDAWDSLGSLNLLLALEDTFSVTLRQEDVVAIHTVGGVLSAVRAAGIT